MDMKEVMFCCFMLFLYSCTSATSSLTNISSSASVDTQAMKENKVGSEGQVKANNNNYNTIRRSIGEEMKYGHGGVDGGGQGGSAAGNGGDNGSRQPGSSNVIPIYAANSHHNPHHGKGSASTMTKPCPWVPALSATLLLLYVSWIRV